MGTRDEEKPVTLREMVKLISVKIDEHSKMQNAILFSLHGDEKAGIEGYYKRVQKLEGSQKIHNRIYLGLTGLIAGAAAYFHK